MFGIHAIEDGPARANAKLNRVGDVIDASFSTKRSMSMCGRKVMEIVQNLNEVRI